MFLIRTAFWLGLVVLLVPVDAPVATEHQTGIDPTTTHSINANHMISLAVGTVSDLSDFCSRNPETCEQGYQAFVAFSHKAKYVSGLAYDYFTAKTDTASPVKNSL